jgi:hypothetical protein
VPAVPAQQAARVVPVRLAAWVAQVRPVQLAVPAVMAPWHRMPAVQAPQAVQQLAARAAVAAA